MSTVIVDEVQRQQILSAAGEVELRDTAGNLVGHATKYRTLEELKALTRDGQWPSDDELDRRSKAGGGFTIDQVIAHLRGLSK